MAGSVNDIWDPFKFFVIILLNIETLLSSIQEGGMEREEDP